MEEREDESWCPPSESDMKILRARQERQDRISRLMGDYLLKGYRMLGDSCETCGTILLQDKQKKLLCISCQELDSDTEKDNPVLNSQAALSQVRERQLCLQPFLENPPAQSATKPKPVPDSIPVNPSHTSLSSEAIVVAETALLDKLHWASQQLESACSVEYSTQLCALIGSCAQSLRSLRELHH
ncbi:hypothetical protein GDO86_008502 [Hymenochirus boettgeri]|uniref:Sjogren syndrome/scleroderma autoantigen 1 n=1 Tax=Hymenochirus boettgeri TaxID=247094 RepID=A0A8T2J3C3_9PIPI|nr:hypothetical protein GDO86_008502 [Hymenochirus boettgeri]